MDSLKDLTDFLKTRDNGASFGELREVFQNEDEIKQFVKIGLENEVIFTTGKKRGTRYYAVGKKPLLIEEEKPQKQPSKKTSSNEYESDLDLVTDINVYLKSDKPIPGQGVFTDMTFFGEKETDNLNKFLDSGIEVTTRYIEYDKKEKRNVITQTLNHKLYNKLALRYQDRKFILERVLAKDASKKIEGFKDYEEFRESLRALIVSHSKGHNETVTVS